MALTPWIFKKKIKTGWKEREGREKDSILFKTITDQVEKAVYGLYSYLSTPINPFFLHLFLWGIREEQNPP